ncbi:TatD family hydrolase [Polaromonas naphthalenivorans]|uniref:TatD-related deoxyribonuclease n=1 Tax=Polaromonas naphthalenivorans (strain CJ2) TaxID=365044 RepID=A1VSB3_POLNA|nr:TatD family hydrolase [Polaromonas naphthalenivorans]ABM38541.1 TatD-related deoxyribonuclease [Polaromonas naphthalenivorans CJ2]
MTSWIDTHCHLDASEFSADLADVRARAAAGGVMHCVLPAVAVGNFEAVRLLAHRFSDSYALGIHPLCVPEARDADLQALDAELALRKDDPRLVAVGEIGLDYFAPALKQSPMRERQEFFYREQLKLARKHGLPVMLHVRRSADKLLKHLRELKPEGGWLGIGHAFNGSEQQAAEFIKLGLKLGFGGNVTFESALQIRRLASGLPLDALVMETDSPDIAPHWIYRTARQREDGQGQGRNEPGELPRIASVLAQLRGMPDESLALATTANALQAFPKLRGLVPC